MRAVLDANVIISAVLSSGGSPAAILRAWLDGQFELIVSPLLLAELQRAFAYPKLRRRVPAGDAQAIIDWLRREATSAPDPDGPSPVRSPNDDYLVALAAAANALLVSGDDHLLRLRPTLPVHSPSSFPAFLEASEPPR